jgi:hypothetical protein
MPEASSMDELLDSGGLKSLDALNALKKEKEAETSVITCATGQLDAVKESDLIRCVPRLATTALVPSLQQPHPF